jgi:hypothetical protein
MFVNIISARLNWVERDSVENGTARINCTFSHFVPGFQIKFPALLIPLGLPYSQCIWQHGRSVNVVSSGHFVCCAVDLKCHIAIFGCQRFSVFTFIWALVGYTQNSLRISMAQNLVCMYPEKHVVIKYQKTSHTFKCIASHNYRNFQLLGLQILRKCGKAEIYRNDYTKSESR